MQKQGKSTANSAIAVAVLAAAFTAAGEEPASSRIVEGNLRVQALSPTLVRIEMDVPAWKVPLFARRGGMILLGPDMQWTQEKP
jgi:hypothetical protein